MEQIAGRRMRRMSANDCGVGRRSFCEDHGIDLENDTFSVVEFIELTINSYGGDVIRELKNTLKKITCQ